MIVVCILCSRTTSGKIGLGDFVDSQIFLMKIALSLNHLKFVWGVIFTGLIVSLITTPVGDFLAEPINFACVLFIIVLLALLSWDRYKDLVRKQYEGEFRLFTTAEDLTPEHFRFRKAQPGDALNHSERPYYDTYIEREFIPYELVSSPNPVSYCEQDVIDWLEQGKSVLLIGNPTEGKTRTLFEVMRKLNNALIVGLTTDKSPSDEALNLLEEQKIVWLFDDLNTYDTQAYDFQHLFNKLKRITKQCALAATCREGPELKDIHFNNGQLHKIYELFDYKLVLKPATQEQKDQLKNAVGETATQSFPTLGAICMHGHFAVMRQRFELLTEYEKDTLRSILLLYTAFILNVTQLRIKAVLKDIFGHPEDKVDTGSIRTYLNKLIRFGFIVSPKDIEPIIPEAAYITEPERKFYYSNGRGLEQDMIDLAKSLVKHRDAEGLNNLALSRYYPNDKDTAFSIWQRVVTEFQDVDDVSLMQQVAKALVYKGFVLRQLGKPKVAITCYDELIERYEESCELVLQKWVAKAILDKGCALWKLGKFEEALECYDKIIQCFEQSNELILREIVLQAHQLKHFINSGY